MREAEEALESSLQERLWAAVCWRDYQLSMTERAFLAEQDQIEADFASEKAQLKESLLAELLDKRQVLLEEKERLAAETGQEEVGPTAIPSAGLVVDGAGNGGGIGGARQSSRRTTTRTSTTKKDESLANPRGTLSIPATTGSKRRAQNSSTNDTTPFTFA